MGRGGESPEKRRIKAQRMEKRGAKQERRQDRSQGEGGEGIEAVDEVALMARFHALNERRSAGAVTDEDFEAERHEIFVALGLEEPSVPESD